jgi:hypothetical protein
MTALLLVIRIIGTLLIKVSNVSLSLRTYNMHLRSERVVTVAAVRTAVTGTQPA